MNKLPEGVEITEILGGLLVEHTSGEGYHAMRYIRDRYGESSYMLSDIGTIVVPEGSGDKVMLSNGERVRIGRSSFRVTFI